MGGLDNRNVYAHSSGGLLEVLDQSPSWSVSGGSHIVERETEREEGVGEEEYERKEALCCFFQAGK